MKTLDATEYLNGNIIRPKEFRLVFCLFVASVFSMCVNNSAFFSSSFTLMRQYYGSIVLRWYLCYEQVAIHFPCIIFTVFLLLSTVKLILWLCSKWYTRCQTIFNPFGNAIKREMVLSSNLHNQSNQMASILKKT